MVSAAELGAVRSFFEARNSGNPLRTALEKFLTDLRDDHRDKALQFARNPQMSYLAGQHSAVVKELEDLLPSFEKWEGK